MTELDVHADTKPVPRSARRAGVRLGRLPLDSDQDLRFVQDRLALFAMTTFLVSTGLLLATTSSDLLSEVKRYSAIGRAYHAFGTLLALTLWLVARNHRSITPGALQAMDVVCTLGLCWSFTAMGHHAAQPNGFYMGLLSTTHVSISRAMIVPSLPSRTLLVAIACFAATVVSRATVPWPAELALLAGPRSRSVLDAVLWSTAGVVVSTVASKVIYGLRQKAIEARQLGQYSLESKIGEGGMGEVYRARHAMLRRPTAIKLLSGDGSEEQLQRFEREVQLTARLTHPNTISIYDYGRTPDGVFYYAMELLHGSTLEQLVERDGPQPPGRVIHLLLQICGALREAHDLGLIHRDIKPANIFLCRRGGVPDFVKVLDFGLVRQLTADEELGRTHTDTVVGTPLYLAPEAILTPDRVDSRVDIYGLGCVAYFLATGTTVFGGQTVVEVCAHHLHTAPEPPSQRRPVPADLERVILACLAKAPDERPQSARVLAEELERCGEAHGWTEADAERCWALAQAPQAVSNASLPVSAEQPRLTISVDLQQRLELK